MDGDEEARREKKTLDGEVFFASSFLLSSSFSLSTRAPLCSLGKEAEARARGSTSHSLCVLRLEEASEGARTRERERERERAQAKFNGRKKKKESRSKNKIKTFTKRCRRRRQRVRGLQKGLSCCLFSFSNSTLIFPLLLLFASRVFLALSRAGSRACVKGNRKRKPRANEEKKREISTLFI